MSEQNHAGRQNNGRRKSARPQNIRVNTDIDWNNITFTSDEITPGPDGLEELSPKEEIRIKKKAPADQPQAELA